MSACSEDITDTWLEEGEQLSGGNATVFDHTSNAFGQQIPTISGIDGLDFFVGNSFFKQNWVTAPASTLARDGLGPLFNARSCGSCHFKDGRGRPPNFPGETGHGLLMRISIPGYGPHGEPLPDPAYGDQLQDDAILGVPKEVELLVQWIETQGSYPDEKIYTLRKPEIQLQGMAYGSFAPGYLTSARIAPQIPGLGLLEAISSSDILSREDPWDADGDGISGRANYVFNWELQQIQLGRFGWKANQPNLRQQVASAFLEDMGITNPVFQLENCTSPQGDCQNAPNGGNPEIPEDDFRKVVLYCRALAIPSRRNWEDETVLLGKKLFFEIGCEKCHRASYTTGIFPGAPYLSGQKIRPYTDLLLHDMGPELADGRPDFLASGEEWRTPPLWGIGLLKTVNGFMYLLHDGRARTFEEAILWHGGEAAQTREKYKTLTQTERYALIKFLESL